MQGALKSGRYDYLVVGAGLYGAAVARTAADRGMKVLVVERRDHIGGNCWSYKRSGIDVHAYGPHALHTNELSLWQWFCKYSDFTPCVMSPIANYKGELYNLPFSMNTFHALWGVTTPDEATHMLDEQRVPCEHPTNLEDHVLAMVGRDVYEKLVKGYTEKQYGKPCNELPPSLISRMPLLLTFDNDYNHKRYQGIPAFGWDVFFNALLEGIEVHTGVDFLSNRDELEGIAAKIVFTGPIDEYYDFCFGPLEYRGRRFEDKELNINNFQGCALMNYTDAETPWLRIIEHKHFLGTESLTTIVTREYATEWTPGDEPYYTVNDSVNQLRYAQYKALADEDEGVVFGGRLGEYRYYAMDDTVKSALALCNKIM